MAEIYSITVKPVFGTAERPPSFLRVPAQEATLLVGYGLEGDAKGSRHPDRQVNILSLEWVERLRSLGYKTEPGSFGEQLIIKGFEVDELIPGERLCLGKDAVVELTKPRTGCERLEAAQSGLPVAGLGGMVGMLARVLQGGVIRVGDPVVKGIRE